MQLHVSESVESRLIALEESYVLAQKRADMALATSEQLKTSDLPAQVLSLHTEVEARFAEMQQSTVSPEQLSQLQSTLEAGNQELGAVKAQVEGLAALGAQLSQQVDFLTGSRGDAESKLEAIAGRFATLGAAVDAQAAEVLGLKELMDAQQALVEANRLEAAAVR